MGRLEPNQRNPSSVDRRIGIAVDNNTITCVTMTAGDFNRIELVVRFARTDQPLADDLVTLWRQEHLDPTLPLAFALTGSPSGAGTGDDMEALIDHYFEETGVALSRSTANGSTGLVAYLPSELLAEVADCVMRLGLPTPRVEVAATAIRRFAFPEASGIVEAGSRPSWAITLRLGSIIDSVTAATPTDGWEGLSLSGGTPTLPAGVDLGNATFTAGMSSAAGAAQGITTNDAVTFQLPESSLTSEDSEIGEPVEPTAASPLITSAPPKQQRSEPAGVGVASSGAVPVAAGSVAAPLLWVAAGVLLGANLFLLGWLLFGNNDDNVVASAATTKPPAPVVTVLTTDPPAELDAEESARSAVEPPVQSTVAPGPVPLSDLPERGAIYRGGKLYLQGPVPSQEIAQQFIDKAAAVVGEENIVNEYILRPDAPIPTDGNVRVEDAVLFESGSAVIAPTFEPILSLGIAVMTINPQVTMVIEGHTDDIGSNELNLALSQQRAQAVADYIVANGGIASDRFEPQGKGESEPIANNGTNNGRRRNRRIEVTLIDLLSPEAP